MEILEVSAQSRRIGRAARATWRVFQKARVVEARRGERRTTEDRKEEVDVEGKEVNARQLMSEIAVVWRRASWRLAAGNSKVVAGVAGRAGVDRSHLPAKQAPAINSISRISPTENSIWFHRQFASLLEVSTSIFNPYLKLIPSSTETAC